MHKDVASIIMDIFQLLDTETAVLGDSKERSLFGLIVKESEKIFSEKLLKERLETDTLQEFGIVAKNFYGKFIKIKTKLYYKQRRFNLFREENEGYAKLMTELNKQADSDGNSLEIVRSLIGCFNVDPNRVLDVILESFEVRLEREEFYIPLLKSYMPDSKLISEVLGYKFRNQSEESTSFSLYQVTAILLQHGIILLNDIYSWLTPNDEQIFIEWQSEIAEAKEYVRKLKIISTNKEKDEKEPVEVHSRVDKYLTNQKMGLCQALLKIGDWKNALEVIERLPDKLVTSYEPIAKELCELIHKTIEPIYRLQCAIPANIKGQSISPHPNKKAPPQCANFMSLRNHVFSMFHTLGPSLHYDPVLLQKLIRIMVSILEKDLNVDASMPPPTTTEGRNALYYDVISLLDSCILPSLSYMTSNCPVAEEIWSVIRLYPYHIRYSLYSRWKNESYMSHPKLIRMRGDAEQNIKALMKRVSKENVKPVGRRIGKLTHSSPGFLCKI
jgi:THO complex subunit 2